MQIIRFAEDNSAPTLAAVLDNGAIHPVKAASSFTQ